LLKHVANTLRANVRPGDTLVRFGTDKFGVILDNLGEFKDAEHVAEEMRTAIKQEQWVNGRIILVTASIGVAYGNIPSDTVEELMRRADTAMHGAKKNGGDGVEVYVPEMDERSNVRIQIEHDLRISLEHMDKSFEVHYMPIVCLETGHIDKFEALMRWVDPRNPHMLIMPTHFIPVAEETGMIIPMGEWIFRKSCITMKHWQDIFPKEKNLIISVNVSLKQVMRSDLVETIARIITETGVDPTRIRIEITESMVMENTKRVIEVLTQLQALNISSFIDDFGAGATSLRLLSQLPSVALKIDMDMLRGISTDPQRLKVVNHIIKLGRDLEQDVITEGIEDDSQLHYMIRLKATHGQGFWFHEAVDQYIVERLIQTQPFIKRLREFRSA